MRVAWYTSWLMPGKRNVARSGEPGMRRNSTKLSTTIMAIVTTAWTTSRAVNPEPIALQSPEHSERAAIGRPARGRIVGRYSSSAALDRRRVRARAATTTIASALTPSRIGVKSDVPDPDPGVVGAVVAGALLA